MRRFAVLAAVLLTLVAAIAGGRPTTAQDEDLEATIAALQTRVAELEATAEARGEKINDQRTQIAELRGDEPEAETPERGERCEDVHENAVAWIVSGLNPDLGIALRGVQAVRSDDFEQVWFVAADIEGPGYDGDDQIAVWAMNRIDDAVGVSEGALTMTVNDVSVAVNGDWLSGPDSDAQATMDDDGASEAVDCTKAAIATQ